MSTAISVEGLGKRFRLGQAQGSNMLREAIVDLVRGRKTDAEAEKYFWALRDLNLDLQAGEVLGIVGRNGAGKSTFLKVLSRITRPTTGQIRVRGNVASLLEVGTGFHEELTGRENVFLSGCILGMPKKRIDAKLEEIVAFAEVERFIDTPIKRYSSGMRLRLGFAVAAHLESDVLIVDEVLAVGDSEFQRKCLQTMSDLHSSGRTVLFVSHNLAVVQNLCSRAIWIESGTLRGDGSPVEVIKSYLSTYATHEGSVRDLRDAQNRSGSGNIRFTRFEVLDTEGGEKSWISSGDSFVFRLHFDTIREITQPMFGVEIHSSLGIVAAQIHTFNSGFEIPVLPVGTGYIDLRINDFNLIPGRYLISLHAKNIGDIWHDNLPHCAAIEVQTSNRYGMMRGLNKNPVALFDVHWEISSTTPRSSPIIVPDVHTISSPIAAETRQAAMSSASATLRLSVVICTWNRASLLKETLECMTDLELPDDVEWELLVVNNNSTDETDDVVRTFAARLPVSRLYEPNPGKSNALNTAVAHATGDYIIFTDDDVLVPSTWLAAYAAAFRAHPDAAFFGGPIRPWYQGTPPSWLVAAFPKIEYAFAALDLGTTPQQFEGDSVPFGANMAVRAAEQKSYHYDPTLGPREGRELRGEEITLLKTMLADGKRGWWVPDAHVRHFVPHHRQTINFVRQWYQGWGHFLNVHAPPRKERLFFGRPLWLWKEVVTSELTFRWKRLVSRPEHWIEDLKAASIARGKFETYPGSGL